MNVLKPHVSLNVSNIDASVPSTRRSSASRRGKRRPGTRSSISPASLNLSMVRPSEPV